MDQWAVYYKAVSCAQINSKWKAEDPVGGPQVELLKPRPGATVSTLLPQTERLFFFGRCCKNSARPNPILWGWLVGTDLGVTLIAGPKCQFQGSMSGCVLATCLFESRQSIERLIPDLRLLPYLHVLLILQPHSRFLTLACPLASLSINLWATFGILDPSLFLWPSLAWPLAWDCLRSALTPQAVITSSRVEVLAIP